MNVYIIYTNIYNIICYKNLKNAYKEKILKY